MRPAEVIPSFPRLGLQLEARVLTAIGDARRRFTNARSPTAYAGSSPVTRASDKKSSIPRSWVKNDRPDHAGHLWAFSAITASPAAKSPYRSRRDQGDWHASAQRNLCNRMNGQLCPCLQQGRRRFNEAVVFLHTSDLMVAA
ncbi:transposase [Streptomyces hundungensis]|uniref:transposase n=1 Tax=Streptomyces hundungensis TaxID=1077946 RepID=UPI00340C4C68